MQKNRTTPFYLIPGAARLLGVSFALSIGLSSTAIAASALDGYGNPLPPPPLSSGVQRSTTLQQGFEAPPLAVGTGRIAIPSEFLRRERVATPPQQRPHAAVNTPSLAPLTTQDIPLTDARQPSRNMERFATPPYPPARARRQGYIPERPVPAYPAPPVVASYAPPVTVTSPALEPQAMPVVAELPPQPVYTEAPPAPQPQVHIAQPAPETAAEPATPMPWHTASLEEALAPTASPAAMAPAANNTLPPMVADFPATTQQAPVTEDSFGQAEPEALADSAPPAIPEMEPADATPVLPEETKKILDNAPKGLDTPKTTMKTPDPVVIRHTAPTAGTIPVVDVRAHEEMGLKIEVRKPNLNVQTYLELAYKNLMDGKTEIAAGYYREVLNVEPKNELALFGLATTYHKMGHTDEARDVYGQVLELNPTHREALNNFMALISEQTPEAAIAELEKLEQENPYFSPVTAQLGMTYKKVGKPREAVEKLLKALELSPDNISYKYNLAVTLDQMGERQQAADMYFELLEDYKTGVTIPGDIQAIRNRAIFLSSLS